MIAEDFCRLRVLARSPQPGSARGYLSQKQEHSPAYGGASMCAQTTFVNSMSGLVQYAG